ncbi:MAG: hypothetical protein PHY79_10385 [Anaerolineae bacterium]|nr:hypothetical protein [Anaerolineae bacterium]
MGLMVGRIVRSSTTCFAVGCETLKEKVPEFGCLVKVRALDHEVYGLIYDVRMEDDPFVRQMAVVPDSRPEAIEDQRRNRQVPIEVAVLVIGYRHKGQIHHRLPPQPPISLDVILTCDGDELVEFTQHLDYFRLVLDNRDLPADELLAANLRQAALARDPNLRPGGPGYEFLLDAGRELARLLAADPPRLDGLLRRLRP